MVKKVRLLDEAPATEEVTTTPLTDGTIDAEKLMTVSYTHLTLPTRDLV